MTRSAPISLVLREDLSRLLPTDRQPSAEAAGANAQQVLQALAARGALFFNELVRCADLLPTYLEDALRELAAQGLITSDAFAAVRKIVDGARAKHRRSRPQSLSARPPSAASGRWSLFPGYVEETTPAEGVAAWCRQLLARYGVVFRELLSRETAAPPWSELVRVFRKMEMRGELRGGRFVGGVGGEQYAQSVAVEMLRQTRDQPEDGQWLVIAAADPLNLAGILVPGRRIPATHKNALALQDGQIVATLVAGEVEYLAQFDAATQWEIRGALRARPAHSHREFAECHWLCQCFCQSGRFRKTHWQSQWHTPEIGALIALCLTSRFALTAVTYRCSCPRRPGYTT